MAIPEQLKGPLSDFTNWHFRLKDKLNTNRLSASEEEDYLNEIIPKEREYYFESINRLGDLSMGFTPFQKKHLFHKFSELGLHQLLRGAPYFYHSIYKPRGYAGDAAMMALVYRNSYEGADTFSKLLHKIGTECDACIAIRNRKDLIRESFHEYQGGKILSLAAGPAQEIYEYQQSADDIAFLALDHDIETLKNANQRNKDLVYGIANAFHIIKGNNKYLIPKKNQLSTCDPRRDTKGLRKILLPTRYSIKKLRANEFDLIYSAGLFDYIKTFADKNKGAVALTTRLFSLLKPGGRMLIGNISPKLSTGVKWAMECLCDWYLIHRTAEEVLDFARAIDISAIDSINVISEPTGVNWFLDIRKK